MAVVSPPQQGLSRLAARYTDEGVTIYLNSRGACERGNYAREMPGWHVEAVSGGPDGQPHTIEITTQTGHSCLSRALAGVGVTANWSN